jgi:hypothetical protein
MTIQNLSRRRKQQASRKKPVKAEVTELIELANSVPPDCELPTSIDLMGRYAPTGYQDFFEQFPTSTFPKFRAIIGSFDSRNVTSALQQYSLIRDAREILRQIARMENKNPGQIVQHVTLFGSASLVTLQVNEWGKIDVKHDRLLELLKCVEVARIRECQVCKLIFWAGRIDQKCCCTGHAKVLRTREWREKYAEQYKLQRVHKVEQKITKKRAR